MIFFWHPLSALFLPEMRSFATPYLLRMLLGPGGPVELLYAGDRMWPSVRHGETVRVEPAPPAGVRPGEVVVARLGAVPDLLRVAGLHDDGRVVVQGDADPTERLELEADRILARADLPARRSTQAGRFLRRFGFDLVEAVRGWGPDLLEGEDPAVSVREKYDGQAPFYVEFGGEDIDPTLLELIRKTLPPASRILVVGSGTGRECFALAEAGFPVRGIDFSSAMVEQARKGAAERGLEIPFVRGDAREHVEGAGSLDAVFFTYDVFSFLPGSHERVTLLGEIHEWLTPGGTVFLSARRVLRPYQRAILTLQWLAGLRAVRRRWGASHTRYITADGSLRRSFVHYFTARELEREVRAAGLRTGSWHRAHVTLSKP
jgi:SAM-dependent methyltransferase